MAVDFITDADQRFFEDNLLFNEDWESCHDEKLDDISELLNIDKGINADDLLKGFPEDLEMVSVGHSKGFSEFDILPDLSDSSDSGLGDSTVEFANVKSEPLSPLYSEDSSSNSPPITLTDTVDHVFPQSPGHIKQECPALSTAAYTYMSCDQTTLPVVSSPTITSKVITLPGNIVPHLSAFTNLNGMKIAIPAKKNATKFTVKSPTSVSTSQNTSRALQFNSPPPGQSAVVNNALPLSPGQGDKLVLTAEEFATLTAQGMLKVATCPSNSPVHSPPPVAAALQEHPSSIQTLPYIDTDMKTFKRQQRMIKNRESACLSRKRKKEYMQTMEEKLKSYNCENQKLRSENEVLKRKIGCLLEENNKLKRSGGPPLSGGVKKATVLMGVVFMLSLNMYSLVNFVNSDGGGSSGKTISAYAQSRIGRTLKSMDTDAEVDSAIGELPNNVVDLAKTVLHLKNFMKNESSNTNVWSRNLMLLDTIGEICPTYFNSTESQRLMKELTGWVMGHKEEVRKQQQRRRAKKPPKRYKVPYRMKDAMKGSRAHSMKQYNSHHQYPVQLFNNADSLYGDLFNALSRRNDTFYVVSFRRDHLLLPATAHNKTMRPRMSLVMPADSLNDSMRAPHGKIAMMQIDCEVMATKLIHVQETSVPHDLLENTTQTQDLRYDYNTQKEKKAFNAHYPRSDDNG